jgi:hypothetical protein
MRASVNKASWPYTDPSPRGLGFDRGPTGPLIHAAKGRISREKSLAEAEQSVARVENAVIYAREKSFAFEYRRSLKSVL